MSLCSCVFTHFVAEKPRKGQPALALCGKVWKPTKDPSCHKRCHECEEVLASMGRELGWTA